MKKILRNFINKLKDRYLCLSLLLGITGSVFLNQLINLLRLKEIFPAYAQNIQSQMFMYPLLTGIILYGIISPLVEEAAFRWILFGRLKLYMATGAAAIFSSIIFGIYHGNFIQFIYAVIFGIELCFVYWRFDGPHASFLSHAGANITVYTTASFGGFEFLSTVRGELISVVISGILTFTVLKILYDSRPKERHVNRRLPIFPRKWEN
ncbi:lysostaphin resistance A-like protein [Lachnospiraceae bacterium C1.1]|nr:CPBP family intramembrane metalloprotease [Lachnospiraceae bacterium C1.1]